MHRDFIQRQWGIDDVHRSPESISHDRVFDAIVAINVLEHIYDVREFLATLAARLSAKGRIMLSTVNARSAAASMLGGMWWAFKEPDHVSFPSMRGLRLSATSAGLRPVRVWSSELPFETPIAVAVAVRDLISDRRRDANGDTDQPAQTVSRERSWAPVLSRAYRHGSRLDPTSHLLAAVGRAATVKVLFEKAAG
jgi:hypothetical protein